jgi:hypothetical protein
MLQTQTLDGYDHYHGITSDGRAYELIFTDDDHIGYMVDGEVRYAREWGMWYRVDDDGVSQQPAIELSGDQLREMDKHVSLAQAERERSHIKETHLQVRIRNWLMENAEIRPASQTETDSDVASLQSPVRYLVWYHHRGKRPLIKLCVTVPVLHQPVTAEREQIRRHAYCRVAAAGIMDILRVMQHYDWLWDAQHALGGNQAEVERQFTITQWVYATFPGRWKRKGV